MQPATQFICDRYEIVDGKTLHFYYRIVLESSTQELCETWELPIFINDPNDSTVQFILRQIHLGVALSYYKAFIPPLTHPYQLSYQEAEYWNTVYEKGLSEFCYQNRITHPIRPFSSTSAPEQTAAYIDTNDAILGIGGGKDSIVAGELLKQAGTQTRAFVLTTGDNHGQTNDVIAAMGLESHKVKRFLDTNIIELTKQYSGYNGHIPISVLFSWAGVLLAYLTQTKYVIVGNEAAANEGNVEWQGGIVNHQWSKSLEFEQIMQDYVHSHVCPDITYVSIIRQFGSLAVAKLFSRLGVLYLDKFTSCNLVLRIDPAARPNGRWCGQCAKCLSSYILLSPFFTPEQMHTMFGKDMLEDENLKPTFHELLGLSGHKPMDCVGTVDEIRACVRELLDLGRSSALLTTVDYANIAGPNIDTLVQQRHPHLIPGYLFADIDNVTQRLAL